MKRYRVRPSGPLRGEVALPGDKSISHRAVLFAALAEGTSRLEGLGPGRDVAATRAALEAMGVRMRGDAASLEVDGVGLDGLRAPPGVLDCGNSGTTLRLLAGLLAAQRFGTRLVGDASLSRRPMARVVVPLRARGAHLAGTAVPGSDEVTAPLAVAPLLPEERLSGLEHSLPVASAQVKSALLLSGLYADGPTLLSEPVLSRDHTERALLALGVPLRTLGTVTVLDPDAWPERRWGPLRWRIPADPSSAAFVLAAAALLPGSDVKIRAVATNPTRTGFLEALRWMGVRLALLPQGDAAGDEPIADLAVRPPVDGRLAATTTAGEHLVRMIDEAPAFAAVAARAAGRSEIRDAAELRHKESDRLDAIAAMLRAFGVECADVGDGLVIDGAPGGRLRAATVSSRGDHRIAMAAAVLGLVADGETRVDDVACVETSFPGFAATLRALGADVVEDEVAA